MMGRLAFVWSLLFVISAKAQDNSPTALFTKLQEKLQEAYSLTYDVETQYHYRGEDKVMHTHFKQKKLSYDPYAGYSFYKEIDKDIKIYYHFLELDRKSTRLNSSHVAISYAVFCLKKKKEWKHT